MITTPAGKLYLNQFDSIKEFFTGSIVNASKYDILDNDYIAGVYHNSNSKNLIKVSLPSDFKLGEAVLVKIGNFSTKNVISNVGDDNFYTLKDALFDLDDNDLEQDDLISIKRLTQKTIKLNDLSVGYYIIQPTNQKLIIRESFQQPFVSLEDLNSEIIDITNLKQYRVNQLRDTALKSIYSELSGYNNYYDIIDEIDLWNLTRLKILCILYRGDTEGENPYCKEFKEKMLDYKPKEKFDENQGAPETIPNANFSSSDWSL